MTRIAVLGLGAMGGRMAANAVRAGHDVAVWNRSPGPAEALRQLGAEVAASPRDAARGADIVASVVRDDAASQYVWLDPAQGAAAALGRESVAVENSTLTVAHVRRLAAVLSGGGRRFLDAPVVGSRPQADAAQLVHLLGGAPDAIEAAQPWLTSVGARSVVVGAAGQATALKLSVNALFAIQVAAFAEHLSLLAQAGLAPADIVEAVGGLPVCSPAAKAAASAMASDAFAPQFPAELVAKDLAYVLGDERPLPVTRATAAVFTESVRRGFGADNLTGVVRLYPAFDVRGARQS